MEKKNIKKETYGYETENHTWMADCKYAMGRIL